MAAVPQANFQLLDTLPKISTLPAFTAAERPAGDLSFLPMIADSTVSPHPPEYFPGLALSDLR